MDRAARVLTSTGFLAGLVLLLANDFVLKQAYPGLLTGKLSDFAGLFIFPMFWSALLPRRTGAIYAATAMGFVWWKSPLSQGVIDGWNAVGVFEIGRVADYTDLIALVAIVGSYAYLRTMDAGGVGGLRMRAAPVVLVVAGTAFAATSYGGGQYELTPGDPATTYRLDFSIDLLAERLDGTGLWHREYFEDGQVTHHIGIEDGCRYARFVSADVAPSTEIRLVFVGTNYNCNNARDGKKELIAAFERGVVARLRGEAEPYSDDRLPKGDRLDYSEGSVLRRTLALPRENIARAIDAYPEKHRREDDVYTQALGFGYFVRYRLHAATVGTEFEVLGYINGFWEKDSESTPEEMEPRFQYFLDYIGGAAAAEE